MCFSSPVGSSASEAGGDPHTQILETCLYASGEEKSCHISDQISSALVATFSFIGMGVPPASGYSGDYNYGCQSQGLGSDWQCSYNSGSWSISEQNKCSKRRELSAIFKALLGFKDRISQQNVLIRMDKRTAKL